MHSCHDLVIAFMGRPAARPVTLCEDWIDVKWRCGWCTLRESAGGVGGAGSGANVWSFLSHFTTTHSQCL
jgi:hypothetical protein